MKGLLALVLVLIMARPADADELLVGVVRDQDGAVVVGAPVTALDRAGKALASDRTATDGTFAISVASTAATLVVAADDADVLRVPVTDATRPFAEIIRRHRSTDLQPGPADVAALPDGSLSGLASVAAYREASLARISDRNLSLGDGVVTIEGLPFYRRSDGAEGADLLPTHATGGLELQPSLDAVWYGDRGAGGVVDARLFDRTDPARAGDRDASLLLGGTTLSGLGAMSWDPDGQRALGAAHATATFGTASASLTALAGTAPGAHYAGFGTEVRDATPTRDLDARLGVTNNVGSAAFTTASGALGTTTATGNNTSLTFDDSGRGSGAIAVRARYLDEEGALGGGTSEHTDAALVLGTTRGNVAVFRAAVALAYGREDQYERTVRNGTALLPSLTFDTRLDDRFSLHAGATASTLGTPGVAIARSSLEEFGIGYTDHRRLQADVQAYAEGDSAPRAVTRGFAASLGWEFAPRLSLRTWAFSDGQTLDVTVPAYPGGPNVTYGTASAPRRQLFWLTWDGPIRMDLLDRAGALEGSVRVPLGSRYALFVSSYRSPSLIRVLSVGITRR